MPDAMNLDPTIAESANRLLASIRSKPQCELDSHAKESEIRAREAARERFNAPVRHWERVVNCDGSWGQKNAIVGDMLGSGMIAGLYGTRGAGKTQIAIEAMRWCYRNRKSALFVSAVEFFSKVKATYRQDSTKSELDVIAEHRKPFLLVIDEVGKRGQTDWENSLLFELLNKRYGDMTDTILTCNLSKDDFQEALGPSLVSRIIECGGLIECNWPSYRGNKT